MTVADDRVDRLLDGSISLRQPASGHRAGTDAVLLGMATPPDTTGLIVDAGAATGAVGLIAARRAPHAIIQCVEIDPDWAALAALNAAENGLAERVAVVVADLLGPGAERRAAGLREGGASLVLTNPPFAEAGTVRASPDPARRRAHVMPADGLERWARTTAALLVPGGRLILIHRADALDSVLAAYRGRLGGLAVRPVHPDPHRPASRILVSGIKGSRAPLALLPPLVLHDATGAFTPEADSIHRGRQGLDWP